MIFKINHEEQTFNNLQNISAQGNATNHLDAHLLFIYYPFNPARFIIIIPYLMDWGERKSHNPGLG